MRRYFSNLKLNKIRGEFSPVIPGIVSPMRQVPSNIKAPNYYKTGVVPPSPSQAAIFNGKEIEFMRESASLARKMLEFACTHAKPGISTDEIDRLTHEEIIKNNAYPSPLNYMKFPKSICTSVNEVCCHGIPDSRILQEGDIISIDVSLFKNGYHGDNCTTVIVGGKCDEKGQELVRATEEALNRAISICHPGQCLSKIGSAIEQVAANYEFQVNRQFCGHGLGSILHMAPYVSHYTNKDYFTLQPGMIFTIEPIFHEASAKIFTWPDGWSAVSVDGGRSAQFEHEVLITETGYELLTVV
jgi:methionyl aminopeptidase